MDAIKIYIIGNDMPYIEYYVRLTVFVARQRTNEASQLDVNVKHPSFESIMKPIEIVKNKHKAI